MLCEMKKTTLKATAQEMKRYVLRTHEDLEILAKCKILEKLQLTKYDKEFVKMIKTQLEKEWRRPLLKQLNKLLKEYARRVK